MSAELSIRDLATALLWGRVATFESLAAYLGLDVSDKKKLAKLIKECIRTLPDIEKRFQSNEGCYVVGGRRFPQMNPYDDGTLLNHIWDCTKSGEWLRQGAMLLHMNFHMISKDKSAIQEAIDIVADPFHPKNQGRSILCQMRDHDGFTCYHLEFSIPETIMELCEEVWGRLPRSHPPAYRSTPVTGEEPMPDTRNA